MPIWSKYMRIEAVTTKDSKKLLEIYRYYIKETSTTLEYEVPKLHEFEKEMARIASKYPFVKAVGEKKEILGYAYLTEFDQQGGYQWSAQAKIFVDPDAKEEGILDALYQELEMQAKNMGLMKLQVCLIKPHTTIIKKSDEANNSHNQNEEMLNFFKSQGFQQAAQFSNSGYKYDQWHDMLWLEKDFSEYNHKPGAISWLNRKVGKSDFRKRMERIIACLIFVIAIPIVAGAYYFNHYYQKSNYVGDKSYQLHDVDSEVYYDENGNLVVTEQSKLDPKSEEELIALQNAALKNLQKYAKDFEKDTYNMLLIGVDLRDAENWNGNSDVMVLVTVNDYTKTVHMTSFLRDLYANIPGVGVRKLNAAYAYGGAQLCVETIESNYGVTIDNWAMVDFNSMREVINVCGGIYLDVSEEEGAVANQYITAMCRANNEDPKMHMFYYGGWQHLDGYMAVGYARNRYTGNNNDFGRTERQRKVLNALIRQMATGDINTITKTVNEALPHITHDVTRTKLAELLGKIPTWMQYNIAQQHIPYDDDWKAENNILVPGDMEKTIQRLTSTIYAGKPLSSDDQDKDQQEESKDKDGNKDGNEENNKNDNKEEQVKGE